MLTVSDNKFNQEIFFSLFLTISIIKNILFLSSSKENENKDNINFNVFTPLYIVFITSFFVVRQNREIGPFSALVKTTRRSFPEPFGQTP